MVKCVSLLSYWFGRPTCGSLRHFLFSLPVRTVPVEGVFNPVEGVFNPVEGVFNPVEGCSTL